jgi:TPR repeat protein
MSITEEQVKELHAKWHECEVRTIPLEGEELRKIYNLWVHDIFEEPKTHTEFYSFGNYYTKVKKDPKKAKSYFLVAIAEGNEYASNALGLYYTRKRNKIDKAITIFEKAIEEGDLVCLNNLGYLYYNVSDYQKAKKYFKLSYKNSVSICHESRNLGLVYNINGKYIKSLYYFSLHPDGNIKEIKEVIDKIYHNNTPLDKYFYDSLPNLKKISTELPPLIASYINLYTKEIDVLEAAFQFLPEKDGYHHAKNHYQDLLSSTHAS